MLNKIDLDSKKKNLPKILSKIPKDIINIYDEVIPVSSKNSSNIVNLKKLITYGVCLEMQGLVR